MFFGRTYEETVVKYKQTVGAVCTMRLKNYADAEDCFQNTFFKLYRSSPDFNDENHLKAWLIRVAINECNKYIRKNKPTVSLSKIPETSVDFPEEKSDMSWALMRLDDKYREVLYLFYAEDYKIEEIAKILNKNENTIKTRLRRGREKLKKIYGGE
ncbi:MAG: sigma-70 family RNA polymerase sigma factor [Ruminococcus sp.]|nr:sigma-70 family RNA polymerase sigma factor [Ruminococcus sp.]